METLFHFVIEDTTRQFSTSATFKISDKISSPMENIYIYISSREDRINDQRNIEAQSEIFPNVSFSPSFFHPSSFSFYFFLAPKIISPPAEKPLLLFLVLLFILVLVKIEREGSRFYRVALSNENKNKIYLSSGLLLLLLLLFARVTCPFLFRFLIESNYYVTRAWNFSNFTADFGHTCN